MYNATICRYGWVSLRILTLDMKWRLVLNKITDNVDWKLVRNTPNFYRDLPPMKDFD